MSDKAQQTPLTDLLRAVPKDFRAQWPIQWSEDGHETGHAMCPLGRLVHEAADMIESMLHYEQSHGLRKNLEEIQ
jgi:hypothetical protein